MKESATALVLALAMTVLGGAGAAADEDRPVALKRHLLAPPPDKLDPVDQQLGTTYKSDLEAEIRRLELPRPAPRSLRDTSRLHEAQSEHSRIKGVLER